jgi:hypothetical protein
MTDTSAILASLDRMIVRLACDGELKSDHRVATEDHRMATTNSLMGKANYPSGHCDHPKREIYGGSDQEQCDSHPPSVENYDEGLARKVLSTDGYIGKNGKSALYQGLASSHRDNAGGHSGKPLADQQLDGSLKGASDQVDHELAAHADASRLDPRCWRDLYEERSAHRQFDGGYPRAEAELLAWRELECRWHMQHGERVAREICAGCRRPIGTAEAILLIDSARVHANGYDCLILHGERWRGAATRALMVLGLQPPVGAP